MTNFTAAVFVLSVASVSANAEELIVHMHRIDSAGVGKTIGTIRVSSSQYGILFTPELSEITPGLHGFHVHQNPSCEPGEQEGSPVPGLTAGGHYDPAGSGKHEGPYGNGHLGDLPALYVNENGQATQPVLAPRLKIADVKARSLMIHAGGDNYSDHPEKLGGGGARIACGMVK